MSHGRINEAVLSQSENKVILVGCFKFYATDLKFIMIL